MDNSMIANVRRRYSISYELKAEQVDVISLVLAKKVAIMAILPTGFGKSLLYLLPPLLLDEMSKEESPHISLVVSPLRSLMHDQMRRCSEMGINAVMLGKSAEMTEQDRQAMERGSMNVVFTSPEALRSGHWLRMMKLYRHRVCVIALDEVHCMSDWGDAFRPDYKDVVNLRSIFANTPLLGLSATVTKRVFDDVITMLQLQPTDVTVRALLPDRPNIFLNVVRQRSYNEEEDLAWVVDGLRAQGSDFPKTVIFAQSIRQVGSIYMSVMSRLGPKAYVDGQKGPRTRLVSMFHGEVGDSLHQYTMDEFSKHQSVIRLLISTVAFGLGVEVPDIRHVVHWGKCQNVMTFWQEIGRCGRDGQPSRATWYPQSVCSDEKELFTKLKKDESACVRHCILQAFELPGVAPLPVKTKCCSTQKCADCKCDYCMCCCNCKRLCGCSDGGVEL